MSEAVQHQRIEFSVNGNGVVAENMLCTLKSLRYKGHYILFEENSHSLSFAH